MLSRCGPRLVAIFCLAVFAAGAQQENTATFRSTTRLVEVNVTALDGKGKPVTGLDKADFEIQDGGKRREIAFFRFDGDAAPAFEPLPENTYSNRNEPAAGRPWNVSALVLDEMNTPPQSSTWVRAQLMRYLQAMTPDSRVAVYKMNGNIQVLHDFTSDSQSLRDRVKKAAVGMPLESIVPIDKLALEYEQILLNNDSPEMAEVLERKLELEMMANQAAQRSRVERTLAAMEALGRHLARVPGRKNLIWITGGFSMLSIVGAMGLGPRGNVESYEEQVRATSKRLAQDGVALYVVDTRTIETPEISDATAKLSPDQTRQGRFQPQVESAAMAKETRGTMETMAAVTGGRYLYNTNDLMRGFIEAANDLRGSYTLGFYSTEADEKWHGIKVKTRREGLSLRHRQGYIAEGAPAEEKPDAWRKTAMDGFGSSTIPITAECKLEGGEVQVVLRIDAHAMEFRKENDEVVALMSIVFADRTAGGESRETTMDGSLRIRENQLEKVQTQGIHYARKWTPDADVVETRVVVRDRQSGSVGTLDLPVRKILSGASRAGG
jgi:VWFA-related protein